jgi:hypothetical protein
MHKQIRQILRQKMQHFCAYESLNKENFIKRFVSKMKKTLSSLPLVLKMKKTLSNR